jgi:C1A family cysteine protease
MNKIILAVISAALLIAAGLYTVDANNTGAIPPHVHASFAAWQVQHGKNYSSPSEKNFRLSAFYKNYLMITATNLSATTYKLALNKFSDLTKEEFLTKHTGLRFQNKIRDEKVLPTQNLGQAVNKNWITDGAVNPIKDQGQCGSCWAFSAIAATEAAYKISKGTLYNLSEQQLVDCSGSFGNFGCNGGWMDYAFQYLQTNKAEQGSDYPYTATDQACQYNQALGKFSTTGFFDVPVNDGSQLTSAVAQKVVSVAIDAYGIMSYTSGIFNGPCGVQLNHGVAAVGYGTDSASGTLYWIVRNSWGTGWGEQGYFRMVRDLGQGPGMCGIHMASSYPNV